MPLSTYDESAKPLPASDLSPSRPAFKGPDSPEPGEEPGKIRDLLDAVLARILQCAAGDRSLPFEPLACALRNLSCLDRSQLNEALEDTLEKTGSVELKALFAKVAAGDHKGQAKVSPGMRGAR